MDIFEKLESKFYDDKYFAMHSPRSIEEIKDHFEEVCEEYTTLNPERTHNYEKVADILSNRLKLYKKYFKKRFNEGYMDYYRAEFQTSMNENEFKDMTKAFSNFIKYLDIKQAI